MTKFDILKMMDEMTVEITKQWKHEGYCQMWEYKDYCSCGLIDVINIISDYKKKLDRK